MKHTGGRCSGRWSGRLLWAVFLFLGAMLATNWMTELPIPELPGKRTPAKTDLGWNLVLVNNDYTLPENWQVTTVQLDGGESVDERIVPALEEMFDAMRAAEVYPVVVSGYRTMEKQESLMEEKVQAFRAEGYSRWKAKRAAREWVALPGTSEHQLGLAVDINADAALCTGDRVYAWLAENAWQYGFIQRYPLNKEKITGIRYEPWHYRYVGQEAAAEIYRTGVCLEEYIAALEAEG